MAYRFHTGRFFGTAGASAIVVAEAKPERLWAAVECDLTTGVPMYVTLTDRLDSNVYCTFELQPGQRIVLSAVGDMPWNGMILLTGNGGTAGYRGGEVYWERTS